MHDTVLAKDDCRLFRPILLMALVVFTPAAQLVAAPVVHDVQYVFYGGRIWVIGQVNDPDENPTGTMVVLNGDIEMIAVVDADGLFWITVLYGGLYGEAQVQSRGHDGELSNTVYIEFSE